MNLQNEKFLEKWHSFSLHQQMAHVGSEISRAISLQQKNDKENTEKSVMRALELIDFIVADNRWKGRLFEILILREVICDMFFAGGSNYHTKPSFLKDYFLFFALSQ